MRLLLDECLPRKLKRSLTEHDVLTVPEMGWAGIKNGALLRLMEPVFDVFVTIDGNMRYQQSLTNYQIGFIVLTALDNTIETLEPLMPAALEALKSIQPGQVIRIQAAQNEKNDAK